MSRRRRSEERFPLDRPPNGMVVEPPITMDEETANMDPSDLSRNNAMAEAGEDMLPPVTDADGNPLPLDDFSAPDDAMVDPTPTEVRRATVSVPAKGVHFNFEPFQRIAQLHAAGQTQEAIALRDSLDPQSRYVYDNIKNMKKVPAAEAARLADEFRQNQDRQMAQQQTPQARAADIAQREKAQKTFDMSNDVLTIMDRLRGFKKGEEGSEGKTPKYLGRVGTFDSGMVASVLASGSGDRAGWYIDHETLEETLGLAVAQANRGQGNFTDTERAMLRAAATGGLNYRRDDKSYSEIFENMYDMFKNKAQQQKALLESSKGQAASGQQAQAAPAALPFRIGQQITDRFGRVGIFRGMDANGNPIVDTNR